MVSGCVHEEGDLGLDSVVGGSQQSSLRCGEHQQWMAEIEVRRYRLDERRRVLLGMCGR